MEKEMHQYYKINRKVISTIALSPIPLFVLLVEAFF